MYYYALDLKNNKKFSYDLANMFFSMKELPVFLCVGNDKIVEDSLGALTGQLLSDFYKTDAIVYGSCKAPLVGERLKQTLNIITVNHFKRKVVVIDSSIGTMEYLHQVSLNPCGTVIDYLNNPTKKKYGDISITAVTYVNGLNDLLFLPIEKKKIIFNMANFIANGIYNAVKLYHNLENEMNKMG